MVALIYHLVICNSRSTRLLALQELSFNVETVLNKQYETLKDEVHSADNIRHPILANVLF